MAGGRDGRQGQRSRSGIQAEVVIDVVHPLPLGEHGGADGLKVLDEAFPAVPVPQDPTLRPQVRDPGDREKPYVRADKLAGHRPFHALRTMVTDTDTFAVRPEETLTPRRGSSRLRVAGNRADKAGGPGVVRRGDHWEGVTSEVGECGGRGGA